MSQDLVKLEPILSVRRAIGRPTKLTPTVSDRIVAAIQVGSYPEQAAQAAGVDRSTFYRWRARGEEATCGPYREFFDAVRQAEAEAEVQLLSTVREASDRDWKAAAWILERRHPDRFARRERVDLDALIRDVAQRLAAKRGLDPDALTAETWRIIDQWL